MRLLTALTLVFVLLSLSPAAEIVLPTGATFTVSQRIDPAWIEHFALANFISWEIFLNTPDLLTLTSGSVQFFDDDGSPMGAALAITPTIFESVALEFPLDPTTPQITLVPGGAEIPAGSSLGIPFPFETIGHNVVPASVDMELSFDEYLDPLRILGVQLIEYRAPDGQAYIYPLDNPVLNPTGILRVGAHDMARVGHRWAFNQRYAYDVGVFVNGSDRKNQDNTNADMYIYGEPVYAMADGVVVVAEKNHPENPEIDVILPGAGQCQSQRCDGMSPPCDPGEFPGSGNQIVLLHDNGEYTTMAHMMPGSNNHLSCGDFVQQGDLLGLVGNVGTTSAPHLHFSSLTMPSPEDTNSQSLPVYCNNIQFASPGGTPRRQLDVGLPNDSELVILPPPTPLPRNAALPQGAVTESEPNDVLGDHVALSYPTSVTGTAENANVGDLAVRGDGIEDIYRIDLTQPDSLRIDLFTFSLTENLDVYVLTEDLRVLNETHQGTAPEGPERVCLELEAGAYYVMVSNVDPSSSADANYLLLVESDPQSIDCTITNPTLPLEMDESCEATITFQITMTDNCCLDPESLVVVASNPTANTTLGAVQLDPPVIVSETEIHVSGQVTAFGLTSCPVVVEIDASISDCSGNVVDTQTQGTTGVATIVDTTPPDLTLSVATPVLWSPNHELVDVGLSITLLDACDPHVAESLTIEVWCDEPEVPETGDGTGNHAPDAKDIADGTLRLRSERRGSEDGRVYLITARAVDACGNEAYASCTVVVPKNTNDASLADVTAQADAIQAVFDGNPGLVLPGMHATGWSEELGPHQ